MDPALVGVKYCGGCRAQYDRKAEYEKAREAISCSYAEFAPAEDGATYDDLLVLCGCPAKCADISEYRVMGRTVVVDSKEGCSGALAGLFSGNDNVNDIDRR